MHAFITRTPELARAQAEAIDKQIAAGEDPGPLAGIPFTVKDIFCVKGTPSTAASRILANFNAPYTATAVERLQAAGALMLGKVNLDEFTYGSFQRILRFPALPAQPLGHHARAGRFLRRSAASVAAGEAYLSLGTDTAGSIRQPAAFCGVVGLKPTYGRVSRYGLIAFGSSLDCPGPLARSAKDAALMLKAMAGPDPRDATAATLDVPDYLAALEKEIKGKRIGLSPDYFQITFPQADGEYSQQPVPEEMRAAVLHAAEIYRALGAENRRRRAHAQHALRHPGLLCHQPREAASNLHRYDGVKYGYSHTASCRRAERLVPQITRRGLWLAAQAAHPDGHVCQRGAIQRAVLPPRPARAYAHPPRF